jgi:hypothetical protein
VADNESRSTASETRRKLYGFKLVFILLAFAVLTIGFFGLAGVSPSATGPWSWLNSIPWRELGAASLAVVLIGFGYEWFVRNESRALIREVMLGLLTDPLVLTTAMRREFIDSMLVNGLEARLGDRALAKEAYLGLLQQLGSSQERSYNYRCKITMVPSADGDRRYYDAFVDLRYDTVLTRTSYWFTAVATLEEYNQLLTDRSWEVRWIVEPTVEYSQLDERVFDVQSVRIQGVGLDIERKERDGRKAFLATHDALGAFVGELVTVEYRFVVKLQKRAHVIMVNFVYPTRTAVVEFEYGLTDIYFVNVFDFFVSVQRPAIRRSPAGRDLKKIEVELNDWALPRSGVLFSWVLASEMSGDFVDLLRLSSPKAGR